MLNNNIIEEWREVRDFENHYEVSNLGRLRSIITSQGTYRKRMKKPSLDRNGYENTKLYKNNIAYCKLIHRLVAEAFIPNPEHKLTVNHIDGIKSNNHVNNLEWNTYSENHIHAFNIGLKSREACKQRMLGTKSKDSKSKYHNVSYDNTRKKWIASIKINKKTTGNKRFDNEEEAALHVNYLLDKHGLTDRPRNII